MVVTIPGTSAIEIVNRRRDGTQIATDTLIIATHAIRIATTIAEFETTQDTACLQIIPVLGNFQNVGICWTETGMV
ncbi:hypothetical protein Y032_0038g3602 [Ancylostoma ceylanicum]|uniref:Uncharacterized protein n=1 Tax=Ancylostoma ceylanicum TaxID=53326 RepID=A0A016UIS5_9BILA|nr:hypothetical protein Y032_0038g3602 [Ancylostoma ceylanicum]